MGNFPMRVRWLSHRYLLNQSYAFFQHEFSGRIATKVMQTALAVRETVLKLLDVMLFVTVYLTTTFSLVINADPVLCWPLVAWLILYIGILSYFVPRLKRVLHPASRCTRAHDRTHCRQLHQHPDAQAVFREPAGIRLCQSRHGRIHGHGVSANALVNRLNYCVWTINMLMVFATGALGLMIWLQGDISPGAIAIVMSLAIRLTGMSHWIMWEVNTLFENMGTVQDGINTISKPQHVTDAPDAKELHRSIKARLILIVSFFLITGYNPLAAHFLRPQFAYRSR